MFLLEEGKGPLKSIFSPSIGRVALIKRTFAGLQNIGLILAQILHLLTTLQTSSNDNGRVLNIIK